MIQKLFSKKSREKKLVDKYRDRFNAAEQAVLKNREKWETLERRIEAIFEEVKKLQNEDPFYSDLLIQREEPALEEVKNKGHIALKFGLKPLDISKIQKDLITGKPKRFTQELESGGALFFSQGVNGEILVYLLETKNDKRKDSRRLLLLKRYSSPSDIEEKQIIKHIDQFFWYSLITSYISNISLKDRYRIYYYKLRSRTLNIDWAIVLPALILIVSIIHLMLFLYLE